MPRGACFPPTGHGAHPLANFTPNRPRTGPEGSRMGAGGVRGPCLGTDSTRATCGVPFSRVGPVYTPYPVDGVLRPHDSPEWPQSGARWPWGMLHHPSGGRILVRNPLRRRAGCLLVMVRRFFSRKWCVCVCVCDLALKHLQMGPNGPGMGLKPAQVECCPP